MSTSQVDISRAVVDFIKSIEARGNILSWFIYNNIYSNKPNKKKIQKQV